MAKRQTRTSEAQKEYTKQRRRINQFISRAEKRGYLFSADVLPPKPKRITKASVRKLEKLTPSVLYKKAVYGGEATEGEIVPGIVGKKLERKLSAKKVAQTRKYRLKEPTQEPTNTPGFVPPENISEDQSFFDAIVITGFRAHIRRFNEECQRYIFSWLDKIIAKYGTHATAIMLNDGAEAGHIVTYKIAYDRNKLFAYMTEMLNYLPDVTAEFKAEIMDALEAEEDFDIPT